MTSTASPTTWTGCVNTDMLHPLGDQDGKLSSVYQYVQGFTDMTAAVESPGSLGRAQRR